MFLRVVYRASHAVTSDSVSTTAQLKITQNGVTPSNNSVPGLEFASSTSGVYNPAVKDPSHIKSPQLPFGENVAVATSAAVS